MEHALICRDGLLLREHDLNAPEAEGKIFEVTAGLFRAALANEKHIWEAKCKCCGHNLVLGDGKFSEEFHHVDDNADNSCLPAFIDNLREDFIPGEKLSLWEKAVAKAIREKIREQAENFFSKNDFDVLEVPRNQKELKKWEKINDEKIRTLMCELTGDKYLSASDKKAIDKIKCQIMPMVGLANAPWAFPYLVVSLAFPRQTKRDNSKEYDWIAYRGWRGEQKIMVTRTDGTKGLLRVPREIAHFVLKQKKDEVLFKDGHVVSFKVQSPHYRNSAYRPKDPLQCTLCRFAIS